MSRTDLIHEAEEAPDAARAVALYRLAIDQTGIISGAVRRQLIAMICESVPAPDPARERPGPDAGADGGQTTSAYWCRSGCTMTWLEMAHGRVATR